MCGRSIPAWTEELDYREAEYLWASELMINSEWYIYRVEHGSSLKTKLLIDSTVSLRGTMLNEISKAQKHALVRFI